MQLSAQDTNLKFQALLRDIEKLAEKAGKEPLSQKEQYQLMMGGLTLMGVPLKRFAKAYEISREKKESKALKDRFFRVVNPFYTFVKPGHPEALRRAQQEAMDAYDSSMADITKLEKQYADQAALKAAQEKRAAELLAERQKIEKMGDAGLPLVTDLAIKKPLKFKPKP
ncbi:MAG: hypothetical protein ACAH80_07705 [Alphaproteobacteria bacterium]